MMLSAFQRLSPQEWEYWRARTEGKCWRKKAFGWFPSPLKGSFPPPASLQTLTWHYHGPTVMVTMNHKNDASCFLKHAFWKPRLVLFNCSIPFSPAVPLLKCSPSDIFAHVRTDIFTKLLSICNGKNLEATQMSISGEWLNKLWNMQMIKYSPAIKKKMFKLYLQGYRSDT